MTCACGAGAAKAVYGVEVARIKAMALASDRACQVAACAALGASVVFGTGGAVLGSLVGATAGAAIGLVPAIFTFGLSIPVFALMGGGLGWSLGMVFWGIVGLLGGGVVGYSIVRRKELASSSLGCAKCVKEATCIYKEYMIARIAGHTGSISDWMVE